LQGAWTGQMRLLKVVMSIFIGNLVPFIINQPLIPYTNKVPSNPPNYLIPVILLFP